MARCNNAVREAGRARVPAAASGEGGAPGPARVAGHQSGVLPGFGPLPKFPSACAASHANTA